MSVVQPVIWGDEAILVNALCQGNERAFEWVVETYQNLLMRLALMYVADRATAEEVTQEAWLGVLRGIHRFEGRSSLKTWICHIVTNVAKTRGQREGRTIPFSAFAADDSESAEAAVDAVRFLPADHLHSANHWAEKPYAWGVDVTERLLSQEVHAIIQRTITSLPVQQRAVITLRDIEGLDSAEVCNMLALTETNQRVLLHRARSKVRNILETYFREG